MTEMYKTGEYQRRQKSCAIWFFVARYKNRFIFARHQTERNFNLNTQRPNHELMINCSDEPTLKIKTGAYILYIIIMNFFEQFETSRRVVQTIKSQILKTWLTLHRVVHLWFVSYKILFFLYIRDNARPVCFVYSFNRYRNTDSEWKNAHEARRDGMTRVNFMAVVHSRPLVVAIIIIIIIIITGFHVHVYY